MFISAFYKNRSFFYGLSRLYNQTIYYPKRYISWQIKKNTENQTPTYPYRAGNVLYSFSPEDLPQKCQTVNSMSLLTNKEPPRLVQMLVRDFIEDSLYNPFYGYYNKHSCILSIPSSFEFSKIKDNNSFQKKLGKIYENYDKMAVQKGMKLPNQLWHTPTELFKPYYGEAIARYILTHYKLSYYPYDDLIIYEVGSGNGTLMLNIMDYIDRIDPDVYARTKYYAIEISHPLATQQMEMIKNTKHYREHQEKIEIINKSILDWNTLNSNPCFFILLEVLDNFPHDLIRYNPITQQAYQALAVIDEIGDIHEFYSPILDPLIMRYLLLKNRIAQTHKNRYNKISYFIKRLKTYLPFSENLIDPEFIPTKQLLLFDILRDYFPEHKLIISDFFSLPDSIQGLNAPIVQTRFSGMTVPCSTYLVKQGYFDIMFPTNFEILKSVYKATCLQPGENRHIEIYTHRRFLEHWADIEATKTISGENPMLDWFENVKILVTQ
ncbi:hypothetical protein T552_00414 [Pneumocystis carinii B80]|uniref:Protein arginine methyltransferase NDUFAF7 n=1 Tax=Pneumocystis carinii (strain B80) TaxID=1408658 RepID=A0A0W4ZQQ3_PNEC8|nr:hypothetical protein T552_00414 [Pneumocystis carinii B80]KTW30702.1 hypothetical protein T552_00414 [Pneumocystis carinii B80]